MDEKIASNVYERIGAIAAKVDAAHLRQDRLESLLRDEVKEMTLLLKEMAKEYKEEMEKLREKLNKKDNEISYGKGWVAGILFLASIFGGVVARFIN